jgi:hypothetical protein
VTAQPKRVTYLLGAGATQGCVSYRGSQKKIVMPGLAPQLRLRMREKIYEKYEGVTSLRTLINDVVDDNTDFEQIITFLEDSPSRSHRDFAADMKLIFSSVLRSRLDDVKAELGDVHSLLYAALIDMHLIPDSPERLNGFLTLNYDVFLEHAIQFHLAHSVDYGVAVGGTDAAAEGIRVLKLHGSFGWSDAWPIALATDSTAGLWIPPGIRKAKSEYPFNAIWGLARELLECDILRIIGCNLGQNDWDLVSLLFTTIHSHHAGEKYEVEVIAWPDDAERMARNFPYLNVKSILEIDGIGRSVVAEVLGCAPTEFDDLAMPDRELVRKNTRAKVGNPFAFWLTQKAELLSVDVESIATECKVFERFLAAS